MSWDLALLNGDMVHSASGDWSSISGTDLLNQRISIRCRLHRGEWVYDEDNTLGSQLYSLVGMPPDKAQALAQAYVREALRDMDEINIDNVQVQALTNRSITAIIFYHVLDDLGGGSEQEAEIVDVTIGGTF